MTHTSSAPATTPRPLISGASTGSPKPVVHPTLSALVETARPRQWLKNVLVFAAPGAAGVLVVPATAAAAVLAAIVLTVASAGIYFVNDAKDVASDRRHPTKALRPVASGRIAPATAYAVGLGLSVFALVAALPLGLTFVAVVATYLALTLSYSAWLKRQPVIDIMAVASGFVLRAIAGAVATGVVLSSWFLLVALFGSLFLVTAKRVAEQMHPTGTTTTRAVLDGYPQSWLQQVLTLSLTGTVLAYATWAFQYVGSDVAMPALALSVVPFLAILLRYSLLVALGDGEAPERLLTSDRFLLVAGAVWAALVGCALYLA
ncbi:decaprenyl-phosphate phosphoribosyltransferase [Sanguibacter gelidistatuariae]|uniref:Decaprenyl-phosphate phosphoribosyltransferase n=1 Tax=Sanguibacter gelidistatuariae TaxID=1814289 RepID=A0A1G6XKP0_9MICO|nr:decaprenyl-phosphate phosphoribosyltransferase [Sanguibacter gelidistatuariae]SDD77877.1 decaprenyl-phosphate phosphoribosyltransferase [Sanguibacter gelidistatuariae]